MVRRVGEMSDEGLPCLAFLLLQRKVSDVACPGVSAFVVDRDAWKRHFAVGRRAAVVGHLGGNERRNEEDTRKHRSQGLAGRGIRKKFERDEERLAEPVQL